MTAPPTDLAPTIPIALTTPPTLREQLKFYKLETKEEDKLVEFIEKLSDPTVKQKPLVLCASARKGKSFLVQNILMPRVKGGWRAVPNPLRCDKDFFAMWHQIETADDFWMCFDTPRSATKWELLREWAEKLVILTDTPPPVSVAASFLVINLNS